MKMMCVDVTFTVKAYEVVDDGIEAGHFEVPPAAIEDAKRRVASIITNDYESVLSNTECKVYRSEVVKLNDAIKA